MTKFVVIQQLKDGLQGIKKQQQGHECREAGKIYDREGLHPKTVRLTLLNTLKEKTERINDAGEYGYKISRYGSPAYILESHLELHGGRAGSEKEIHTTTLFGNDAADSDDYLRYNIFELK